MSRNRRAGFSLLEVVLALAILVGALAVLGELLGLGTRHAREAADVSMAQVLCESKLAEIVAGITPATSAAAAPCENDPDWLYSITADSAAETGLLAIKVTVTESRPTPHPVEFTLARWLRDPAYVAEIQAAQQSASSSSSTSGGSSSGAGT